MAKKLTRKKLTLIIVIAAVVLIAAGGAAYYSFIHNKPATEQETAQEEAPQADMSIAVESLSNGNNDEVVTQYDALIDAASDDNAKASLYLQRAALMRDYGGEAGFQQMLDDALKAEELNPNMGSAYMLFDASQRLGNTADVEKYQALYNERLASESTDPNEGPQ